MMMNTDNLGIFLLQPISMPGPRVCGLGIDVPPVTFFWMQTQLGATSHRPAFVPTWPLILFYRMKLANGSTTSSLSFLFRRSKASCSLLVHINFDCSNFRFAALFDFLFEYPCNKSVNG